ncbi:helix-turn-helix domain-containing protein [Peribacillus butanolivorans]|uniref:helix-turn-helix domain-containing protein n=1 Tax=Peribacillus butanolivorans TaxID=421767 RepID=UPI0036DC00CB
MNRENGTNEQQKDDLFLKVSIKDIQGGFIGEIGMREFSVLSAIASFANDKGECFPSQDKLAAMCGVNRRTIIRLIDSLCEYRTADGKPVLIRETIRKEITKTQNNYTVLPSAGMAFGANKVVSNLSQRKNIMDNVKNSNEVVTKLANRLCQNVQKGSDKNVTLTKAIELNPLELNPLEQEPKGVASFVKKKNDYIQDNKMLMNQRLSKIKNRMEKSRR